MKIFINAGHYHEDSGATVGQFTESDLVMKIRDLITYPNVIFVPDNLDLKDSIAWINGMAEPEDLAVSIHLNANNNTSARGTEAYYSDKYWLAEIFARTVSQALNIPNRGARHDSETFVGSLGWLRKLKCQSVLVEACYLTNPQDRALITFPSGQKLTAQGIEQGIREVVGKRDKLVFLKLQLEEALKQLLALLKVLQSKR